jgi:predicted nucleic acid-binding protein
MRAALFDSCILIDYLNGVAAAADTLKRYGGDPGISVITWMEVMVGAQRLENEQQQMTRRFLARFLRLALTDAIAERAVVVRSQRKIRLPDAVIEATAQVENRLLVTRNTKDFGDCPGVIFPYAIRPD